MQVRSTCSGALLENVQRDANPNISAFEWVRKRERKQVKHERQYTERGILSISLLI